MAPFWLKAKQRPVREYVKDAPLFEQLGPVTPALAEGDAPVRNEPAQVLHEESTTKRYRLATLGAARDYDWNKISLPTPSLCGLGRRVSKV